jgi:hypothetical protein
MIDYNALIRNHQSAVAVKAPAPKAAAPKPAAQTVSAELASLIQTLKTTTCKIKYRKADRTLVDMEITLQSKFIPSTSTGTARVLPDNTFSVWSVDRNAWRTLKFSGIEEVVDTNATKPVASNDNPAGVLTLTHSQQIALNHFISETVRPTMKSTNKTMTLEFRATKSGYDVTEKNTGLTIDL